MVSCGSCFKDALYCIVLYLKTSQDEYRLKHTKWLTRFFSFFCFILLFVTECKYEWCLVDLVSRMLCIVLYLKTSQDEYRLKQTKWLTRFFFIFVLFFFLLQSVSMNGVLWILFQGWFVLYCIWKRVKMNIVWNKWLTRFFLFLFYSSFCYRM